MAKLPCIDCITLASCKSLLDINYQRFLEIDHTHKMSQTMSIRYDSVSWIETLMIKPILTKCSIANTYMVNNQVIGLDTKRVTALFSYLHIKGYLLYSEMKKDKTQQALSRYVCSISYFR